MLEHLKYLDNFYLEPNQTVQDKVDKIKEEQKEVIESYDKLKKGQGTSSELAQEVLDSILTNINLLKKLEREELITINTEVFIHSIKLCGYVESGKYEIENKFLKWYGFDICDGSSYSVEEIKKAENFMSDKEIASEYYCDFGSMRAGKNTLNKILNEDISELCRKCEFLNKVNGMCLHYTNRMINITKCVRFEEEGELDADAELIKKIPDEELLSLYVEVNKKISEVVKFHYFGKNGRDDYGLVMPMLEKTCLKYWKELKLRGLNFKDIWERG